MGSKKRPIVINMGLPGWVMTYGDMMSLLLTFFVLIVSFSSMQEAKFKDAALSLRQAFGVAADDRGGTKERSGEETSRHEVATDPQDVEEIEEKTEGER